MRRRLQKRVTCSLSMIIVCACSNVHAQSQTAKTTKIELKDYGWQPLPKAQRSERPGRHGQLVSIDHKGRVWAAFTARENLTLATREHPQLSLHILRFTPDSKLDLSLVLPTRDYFTYGLYLGPNDELLACANDALQVPSRDDPAAAAWQPLAPCLKNWLISQSPSRQTLIVNRRGGQPLVVDMSSSPPACRARLSGRWTTIYRQVRL